MTEPESEPLLDTLIYDTSAARLRDACRVGGVVLLASPLLPFEVVSGRPVFVWSVLAELHPATAAAALAPLGVGAVLLSSGWALKRPSLLAWTTLLALATWNIIAKLGMDAAAWDFMALPDSLDHRAGLATLAIALSGAALRLAATVPAARPARAVAGAAGAAALAFALWPDRGELPLQTLLRALAGIYLLTDLRFVLGHGLVLVMASWPLIGAAVALLFAFARDRSPAKLAAELVTFGLPGLLAALVLRRVLLTYGDTSVVAMLAFTAVVASLFALAARAVELGVLWIAGVGRGSELERGSVQRYVALSAAATVATVACVFVIGRPLKKGIDWPLTGDSSPAAKLFGELVPRWVSAHARWGLVAPNAASAEQLAATRSDGNEMLRAARAVDPGVAAALGELAEKSSDLDLAGRRWFHLVLSVDEAARRARLPYYLDPSIQTLGGVRTFGAFPYHIERVRVAHMGGTELALLHVRQLGEARASHQRLGFSRDMQPFALVVLDEIRPYAQSLIERSLNEPPSCDEGDDLPPVFLRCGKLLRALGPTEDAVRRIVERHELQHQLDGPDLPYSSAVLKELAGYDDAALDEVNRELSAYLAELVVPEVSPKLALVHTLPFLFASRTSALHLIGKLELLALAQRAPDSLNEASLADAADQLFAELAALSDEQLRERARAAHGKLFDAPLPDVRLEPEP